MELIEKSTFETGRLENGPRNLAKPTPRVFAVFASVTQTSLRRNPVPNEESYRSNFAADHGDFKAGN